MSEIIIFVMGSIFGIGLNLLITLNLTDDTIKTSKDNEK